MNRSVIIAITIAVGVTGWILSGQFASDEPEPVAGTDAETADLSAALEPNTVSPLEVQVRTFVASERTQEVVVRGKTEAFRTVELKAETPGRVVEVLAERGQRVKEGDILVKFAVKARLAQLAEAEALVRQREIEYAAAKSLNKKGFSANTTLASSKALLDSALAQAKSVRIMLEDLIIRAPFDGIVEERHVEIGDYLKDGNPVATVVDEDPFLVTGQISEMFVNRIKVGDRGTARLVTGETVSGTIRFIGKTADPATRTFRVELLINNTEGTIRSGVTAETVFLTTPVQAHFMSPAYLTLNDEGTLGIRIVDDGDIVRFVPVSILSDSNDGAWVRGLPETARVIVVGNEFVKDGEKVVPVTETAGARS